MRRGPRSLVVTLLALAACLGPQPYPAPAVRASAPAADGGLDLDALAPNDVLEVRVYQEADLSGVYRVTPAGEVDFPLCGKVRVAGTSASEAAERLTACLKNGFVRRPQVAVMVKEFNSKKVFVFGEVSKPGAFPYEEGMTILHAVSAAGGFNRTASKNSVNVTRTVDGQELKIPVRAEDIVVGRQKNFPLQPGDIIFVPESFL
jgi:protein involved in polysaccharide export with SLBB domain